MLRKSTLVNELHFKIQDMNKAGQITNIGSCLIEVLETAFAKFLQLNLIDQVIQPEGVKQGNGLWLKRANNCDQKIVDVVQMLGKLNGLDDNKIGAMVGHVNQAIEKSLFVSIPMEKL